MGKILKTKSYNYNQVNLIAQEGIVTSRSQIAIEGERIVVSAMSSIIGPSFIKAVANLSEDLVPTLHIPRDIWQEENLEIAKECNLKHIFVGVGLKETKMEEYALSLDFKVAFIDIANGYLPQIRARVQELKNKGFEMVLCGSVHTQEGYNLLKSANVDIIRSGIAPGSVCITADSTGVTRGTFTEIHELFLIQNSWRFGADAFPPPILADGGIKSPADCVKAFAAGADYIMSGRLFVECAEARMHSDGYSDDTSKMHINTIPMHKYFGMASEYGKMCMGVSSVNIEGKVDQDLVGKYSLEEIFITLWAGIRSGVSYLGYRTLTETIGNGTFEIKG